MSEDKEEQSVEDDMLSDDSESDDEQKDFQIKIQKKVRSYEPTEYLNFTKLNTVWEQSNDDSSVITPNFNRQYTLGSKLEKMWKSQNIWHTNICINNYKIE